jgi:uncharacterized membrane protein YbhN (UPF0104 family)
MKAAPKSALWSIGKYVLAAVLLYFIIRHAGVDKILGYLRRIPLLLLLLGFALVTFAQLGSALRMRYFFRASGFPLSVRYATILFYVGAFYNFLLPGGIGGDAYKVILARRRMNVTASQGIRIMLADRASGLCVLMLTLFAGLFTLDITAIPHARASIIAAAVMTLLCYLFFSRLLMRQPPAVMMGSLPYSLLTQGLWIAGLLTIWAALGNGHSAVEYVVLYCAASITGMLPVSVGGLGIKEMTYFYGAQLLRRFAHSGVDGDLGIAISLCIFFLTFATSLPGLLWLNKVEKAHYL